MGATGVAANPVEYRDRLHEQSDEQIDAWSAEAMRDVSIRRGVRAVLHEYQAAAGIDDRTLERVFAAGDGPPSAIGRDAGGNLFVPATTLHCLVAGTRAAVPDAREKLISFLVLNFDELVYV